MVVVARMVLLVAESANKPGQDGVSSGASSSGVPPEATAGGEEREKEGIEHGDIIQALSGAHLREIGIAIKEARPGWQEAHVQVRMRVCVLWFCGVAAHVLIDACEEAFLCLVALRGGRRFTLVCGDFEEAFLFRVFFGGGGSHGQVGFLCFLRKRVLWFYERVATRAARRVVLASLLSRHSPR